MTSMQASALLWLAMVSVAVTIALLAVAVVVRKAGGQVLDGRRARLAAVVRPRLLEYVTDEDDATEPPGGSPAEARALVVLARDLLPKLRGDARQRLVTLLDDQGLLDAAERRLGRVGSVGRARAAELLGAAGVVAAESALRERLGDREPEVRIVAARALGRVGTAASARALIAALDGPEPLPAGPVATALLHLGPVAVEPLRDALVGRRATVRAVAADLLGHLGALSAVDALVERLGDPEPAVRVRAAVALGRLEHPAALGPLTAALTPVATVSLRAAAAEALGRLGGGDAVDALAASLSDVHPVASAAARALVSCGPAGTAALEAVARAGGRAGAHADEALAVAALARRARTGSRVAA